MEIYFTCRYNTRKIKMLYLSKIFFIWKIGMCYRGILSDIFSKDIIVGIFFKYYNGWYILLRWNSWYDLEEYNDWYII